MSALKEFVDFISLNMTNLAATYSQLLAASNAGYEVVPADSRAASARKLLNGVIEAYRSQTSDPLSQLFSEQANEGPGRWAEDVDPPQPLVEIECLGQTLVPVITSLEAGKFLWQILSETRASAFQALKNMPLPAADFSKSDEEKREPSHYDDTENLQVEEALRQSLELRNRQVRTITEVAQQIAAAPALDELFRRVVNLIQERFDYYHAQVYTLEEDILVMQEGTGEAGRQMKGAGHKIELAAEKSLVARAARSAEPVLVSDVSQEPAWLPNPLLPETASEIAVPIKLRDEVLGVLDVQGNEVGSLNQEDQILLMDLCGQIAVAFNNRRIETERARTQVVLLESEQKYKELVDDLPVGIYRNTPGSKGHFLEANPAIVAMFEADSKEEFLKHNVSDLYLYPEDRKRFSEKMLQFGFLKNEELRLKTLQGNEIWGAVTAVMKEGAGGQIYLDGIIEDITERKRVAEALQASEERHRKLLESSPDPIVIYDLEGRVDYVNPAFTRLFGWTEDELLGERLDFVPEEAVPETQEAIKRLFSAGQVLGFETNRFTKDGRILAIQLNAAVFKDGEGNPAGSVIISRDITASKRAEETLRKSEERYRTILESIEDGYYEVDVSGSYTFFNDSICRMLGYSKDEMMGLNNRQCMDEENAQKVYKTFNQVYRTGEPVEALNYEVIRKDGTKRFHSSSVSLIKDSKNRPIGFRGIIHDVTDVKTAQEAAERHAGQEQTIRQIIEEMQHVTGLAELVKTTARELGERLAAGQVMIELEIARGLLGTTPRLERSYYLHADFSPLDEASLAEAKALALALSRPAITTLNGQDQDQTVEAIVAPITLQDKTVGTLQLHAMGNDQLWTENDLAIVATVIDRLAESSENLRLFEEIRRQANYERLVGEITEKLRRAPTIESLVKTAGEELGQVLGVSHSLVKVGLTSTELHSPDAQDDSEDSN